MHTCNRLVLAIMAAAFGSGAIGQDFPTRPVRMIVPVSPGATTDALARLVAANMAKALGQQVVVENRPGASGIIGTESVARSAPDGHTILIITSTHTINPALRRKLPYDALADFSPITLLAQSPTVLILHPSIPARSVAELVRLAKAAPGELNFGSGGNGSSTHLVAELFRMRAGVKLNHVPYKGAGPALTDVVAGQIPLMFSGIVPALPHVKANRVRALAVTSREPSPALPAVPPLADSGLPDFEFGLWYGLLGPAGLAPEVVRKLNEVARRAAEEGTVKRRLTAEGGRVSTSSPAELLEHMTREVAKYRTLVRDAGIAPRGN